jgi:hypothetical protein
MLLFNALYPSIYNLPADVCVFVSKWTTWPTLLSLATVQLLLILRVYCICNRSKRIATFLGTLFILSIIGFTIISIFVLRWTTAGSAPPLFPGCSFIAPNYIWTTWIPPVLFESVIVVVTVYNVMQYKQSFRRRRRTPDILYVPARDSLIYFIIMFSALVGNLLLYRFQTGYFAALLLTPSCVIACVAASRMTMNLREVRPQSTEVLTMEDFGFTTVEEDDD